MLDDPNETPNKVQAPSTLSGVKPLMSQSSPKKKKGHQHDCNSDIFFVIFIQLVSLPPQLWNLKESSPTFGGEPFSHPLTPNQKKKHLFSLLKKYPFHCKKQRFFHVSSCFFQHPLNGLLMPAGFITARIPELHVRTEETEAISSTNPLEMRGWWSLAGNLV